MSDQEKTTAVLEGDSKVKTLTRSEQRKKNRLEHRVKKKDSPHHRADETANIFVRSYNFFVEAKEELGRVIWPSRKETFDSTWRLLILVILCGLFLGLVDGVLTRLLSLIV